MKITGLTPYLYYKDADAALDWMQRVLGFTDPIRWSDETGRTQEADISVGAVAKLSISGGAPADGQGSGALLIVHVDDVDAYHHQVNDAVDFEVEPPQDMPYGPRTFTVTDPWGYRWNFWQGEATPPSR